MRIVNIIGGLGNQMFQYALALALEFHHKNETIRIDTSGFRGYLLHNGYELDSLFGVKIPEASIKEQVRVFYPLRNYKMWQIGTRILPRRKTIIYERKDMKYDSSVLFSSDSAYYLGYWQTEKYFKDIRSEILSAFQFKELPYNSKNRELVDLIKNRNAIGMHIRRRDYVKIGNTQGICTLDYYKKAIELIQVETKPDIYIVFSDDISWCQENIATLLEDMPILYVDWNKGENSFRDMQLMSLCKHNIIANSSFSWWGAWLNQNPDKIVIAPSRWMNSEGWSEIIPEDWITIKV